MIGPVPSGASYRNYTDRDPEYLRDSRLGRSGGASPDHQLSRSRSSAVGTDLRAQEGPPGGLPLAFRRIGQIAPRQTAGGAPGLLPRKLVTSAETVPIRRGRDRNRCCKRSPTGCRTEAVATSRAVDRVAVARHLQQCVTKDRIQRCRSYGTLDEAMLSTGGCMGRCYAHASQLVVSGRNAKLWKGKLPTQRGIRPHSGRSIGHLKPPGARSKSR